MKIVRATQLVDEWRMKRAVPSWRLWFQRRSYGWCYWAIRIKPYFLVMTPLFAVAINAPTIDGSTQRMFIDLWPQRIITEGGYLYCWSIKF